MENKEKIILNDGTEFEIENGAMQNCIQITCTDFKDIEYKFSKLTESNLEKYKIQNSNGLTCATIENKKVKHMLVIPNGNDITVNFNLEDVDLFEKRLEALEESQNNLIESQEIQDGAISDLGDAISNLVNEDNVIEDNVVSDDTNNEDGGE